MVPCSPRPQGVADMGLSHSWHLLPGVVTLWGKQPGSKTLRQLEVWWNLGRGARGCAPARTGSQQRLSLFPCSCGRDVRPLLQIWHCKQGVSLHVPLLKLQKALWAQG